MEETTKGKYFSTNGAFIGGIYPFPIRGVVHSQSPKKESLFSSQDRISNKFLKLRRRMYDPEQRWSDAAQTLFFNTKIEKIVLSSGREFNNASLCACISAYKIGYGIISFWIDIKDKILLLDELIELTALARGTAERIIPEKSARVIFYWGNDANESDNFRAICELIENAFENEYLDKKGKKHKFTQFIYPVIYIKEISSCKDSDDIVNYFSREVAGILDLWIFDSAYLKDQILASIIRTDIHPFKYGVTCLSSSCTVELHPSIIKEVAEKEGQSLEEHHLQELIYLFLLCEVPVAQFYILREYDEEISVLQTQVQFSTIQILNPIFLILLIFRSISSTKIQRKLMLSINDLRYIRLTRKSYLRSAIALFRNAFGVQTIEESIDKKLASISNNINSTYSMLTTIFTLIISLAALIIAFFQVF